MEYKPYISYEKTPENCGECGELDDFFEPEGSIHFRVVVECAKGEKVIWMCAKCAATRYNIPEARQELSDLLPRNPDYQQNFFKQKAGEQIPEGEPTTLLEELEKEVKQDG